VSKDQDYSQLPQFMTDYTVNGKTLGLTAAGFRAHLPRPDAGP
jgi:hypothetical protein